MSVVVDKRLLTVKETSEYLGVTPGSLYQMVHRRTIPFVKMGKVLRFDIRRLDEYIDQNTIEVINYKKFGRNKNIH